MCSLDNEDEDNIKSNTEKNIKNRIKNKIKKLSRSQKSMRNNYLSGLTTYITKSCKSFKRNRTILELFNSNNKFKIFLDENKSQIKRRNNSKKKFD